MTMSAAILDRLNARIAAEPALTDLDTLFVDLNDARDALLAQVQENTNLKDILSSQPAISHPPAVEVAPPPSAVSPSNITEAISFLQEAKGRLAVNSPSSAGDNIDLALRLLS
jgi:hypothetical protein